MLRLVFRSIFFLFITTALGQRRILNGKEAILGQFPYHALLFSKHNNWNNCGASIIHKRWVLTAAHCIEKTLEGSLSYYINVGGINTNGTDGTRYEIEIILKHEEFPRLESGADIALIRLKTDIQFNKYVSSVRLPKNDANIYENKLAVLSGAGITNPTGTPGDRARSRAKSLRFVDVRVIDHKTCINAYPPSLVQQDHLCTLSDTGGDDLKAGCNGDSGGPLVIDGTQVGIVSFSDTFCALKAPNVYARVSYYLTWISQHLDQYNDVLPH